MKNHFEIPPFFLQTQIIQNPSQSDPEFLIWKLKEQEYKSSFCRSSHYFHIQPSHYNLLLFVKIYIYT